MGYLFAAYAVVWLALLGYTLTLTGRINSLTQEIGELKDRLSEDREISSSEGK